MKVQIINKDECRNIFREWGIAACMCYNTPEKFAERVGKSCLTTKHFSGSRGSYIKFKITEVPRALVDQLVRHEQGVFKNVESGRYVNMENFEYYTSPIISGIPEAKAIYDEHMKRTKESYKLLVDILGQEGITGEKAYEAARGISPMNYETGLVIGFTIEALINLMNKRLCVCSQDHIRKLALIIKSNVLDILPELRDYLVPICVQNLYCPESKKRSCGRYPQKEELKKALQIYRIE